MPIMLLNIKWKEARCILWEKLDLEKQDSFHDSRDTAAVFHTSVTRKIETQVIREPCMICSKITGYRKYKTHALYSLRPKWKSEHRNCIWKQD